MISSTILVSFIAESVVQKASIRNQYCNIFRYKTARLLCPDDVH